jgi:hypothetical protein
LGIVIRLIPKIGILRILAIKAPSSTTENLFVKSLDDAAARYGELLAGFSTSASGELVLANLDLDTGAKVVPGAYRLTDVTYAKLLHKVTQEPAAPIPPALREDILAYYSDPAAPISTKRNVQAWKQVLADLTVLKQRPSSKARNER